MSLVSDSPAVLARFDAICTLTCANRRGITPRELEAETPDPARVADCAVNLDLDPEDLR